MSVNNKFCVLNTFNNLSKFFVHCKVHSIYIFNKHRKPLHLHQHRLRQCYRLQLRRFNLVAVLQRSRRRVA